MKRLVCSLFAVMLAAMADTCLAQETLIDVPSLEIVESKKIFFQSQGTFTSEDIITSATVGLGLGNDFEAGITIYQLVFQKGNGVEVDATKPEDNPDFLLNAQKAFSINDRVKLGLGTRSGINAARSDQEIRFVNFDYLNSQFSIGGAGHKIIAGGYYANDAYLGYGRNFGAMAGFDFNVIQDKLHVIADVLSGNSSASTINAGIEMAVTKEWKVSLGTQLPFPESGNDKGAFIQITKH